MTIYEAIIGWHLGDEKEGNRVEFSVDEISFGDYAAVTGPLPPTFMCP